jgi:hypothetical protein
VPLARMLDADRQDQRRIDRRRRAQRPVGARARDGDAPGLDAVVPREDRRGVRAWHQHMGGEGEVVALGPEEMFAPVVRQPAFERQGMVDHRHDGRPDPRKPVRVDRPVDEPVEDQRPSGVERREGLDGMGHVGRRGVGEAWHPVRCAGHRAQLAQAFEQAPFVDVAAGERRDVAGNGEGGGAQRVGQGHDSCSGA